MVTVLKLGGSVITRKDEPETLDQTAISSVASAVGGAMDRGDVAGLVLVHGGGSYGHPQAAAHGLSETDGTRDADAIWAVHRAMCQLNEAVVDELQAAGSPAVPVHPLSLGYRNATGALNLPTGAVATMLDTGFVPVLHGDVITHEGVGATILSGDEIVVSLADSLDATRVGLCADVPGVLAADGTVVPEIDDFETVADAVTTADTTDVTGGMAAKVRRLLALEAPASIFDVDGLPAFLQGESPGTTIR